MSPRRWKSDKFATQRVHPCTYCRTPLREKDATVDHFVPKAMGGVNRPANFRIACLTCNGAKAAMPADVFARWCCERIILTIEGPPRVIRADGSFFAKCGCGRSISLNVDACRPCRKKAAREDRDVASLEPKRLRNAEQPVRLRLISGGEAFTGEALGEGEENGHGRLSDAGGESC